MAISRNDRTGTYVNDAAKQFQLVTEDNNAATEELLAYSGTANGTVVLHGAGKSTASLPLAATVETNISTGVVTLNGIGMDATPSDRPLVIDVHYKDIIGWGGVFTQATLGPAGTVNSVIYNTDLGIYQRFEGGVWVDKGSNYQEVGIVTDVFSSLSISVSAATSTTPKAVNAAAWAASVYGDNVRDVFQNGGELQLTPYLDNPNGPGSIFANLITDRNHPSNIDGAVLVTDVTATVNQVTRVLTINRGDTDGNFLIEWGVQ